MSSVLISVHLTMCFMTLKCILFFTIHFTILSTISVSSQLLNTSVLGCNHPLLLIVTCVQRVHLCFRLRLLSMMVWHLCVRVDGIAMMFAQSQFESAMYFHCSIFKRFLGASPLTRIMLRFACG